MPLPEDTGNADEQEQGGDCGQGGNGGVAPRPFSCPFERCDWPRQNGFAGQPAFKVVREQFGGGVAAGRFLFQTLEADGFQVAIHRGLMIYDF
jgi:hypothetical protein